MLVLLSFLVEYEAHITMVATKIIYFKDLVEKLNFKVGMMHKCFG